MQYGDTAGVGGAAARCVGTLLSVVVVVISLLPTMQEMVPARELRVQWRVLTKEASELRVVVPSQTGDRAAAAAPTVVAGHRRRAAEAARHRRRAGRRGRGGLPRLPGLESGRRGAGPRRP